MNQIVQNHLNNTNKVQTIILLTSILCIIISSIALVSTLNTLKKNSIQLISVNEKLCQTNADYDKNSEIDLQDFSLFKKYYISCSRDSASANCKDGDLTCDLNTSLEDFQEFKDQFGYFHKNQKLKFGEPKSTQTPTNITKARYIKDSFDGQIEKWFTGNAVREITWDPNHLGPENVALLKYEDNQYKFDIPLTRHGGGLVDTWFINIAEYAPFNEQISPLPDTFCLEARAKFANSTKEYDPWWAYWGIIFGGNEEKTEFFSFKVNANHDFAVLQNINYVYPGNRGGLPNEDSNIEKQITKWGEHDLGAERLSSMQYNTLKVKVQNDNYQFLINDQVVVDMKIEDVLKDKIGIIGGSWEYTPVEIWFDYFLYDADCTDQS